MKEFVEKCLQSNNEQRNFYFVKKFFCQKKYGCQILTTVFKKFR